MLEAHTSKEHKLGTVPSNLNPHGLIEIIGTRSKTIYIGRHHKSDYQINGSAKRISRLHCMIKYSDINDSFFIKVLGSNGVKIDYKRYWPNEVVQLRSKDIIDIVGVKVIFLEPKPIKIEVVIAPKEIKYEEKEGMMIDPMTEKEIKFDDRPHFALDNEVTPTVRHSSPVQGTPQKFNPSFHEEEVIDDITAETATSEDELFIDLVLQTFAGMDKRTPVPLSELYRELNKFYTESNFTPAFLNSKLNALPMFDLVQHLDNGKKPKDDGQSFYYKSELDWNGDRRLEVGTLIRKPRECTLGSKQYYFKPPPKLPKYAGGSKYKK